MPEPAHTPATLLENSLASGRIHSAYLITGAGEQPRATALWFARAIACTDRAAARGPCEACASCRRSGAEVEEVAIDGSGKSGPLYRHVGEHADLYWVERGASDTRVRIGQVRALQNALRLGSNEGGARAAVVADAEWLNAEAQNALLRLLEEPPEATKGGVLLPQSAPEIDPRTGRPTGRQLFMETGETVGAIPIARVLKLGPPIPPWKEGMIERRAEFKQGDRVILTNSVTRFTHHEVDGNILELAPFEAVICVLEEEG